MINVLFCNYLTMVKWLQNILLPCFFKRITGFDCPLCGLQRSVIALLQGNFITSFSYHPATIPLIMALLLSISKGRLNFKNRETIRRVVYSFTAVIIAVFYVYKINIALS